MAIAQEISVQIGVIFIVEEKAFQNQYYTLDCILWKRPSLIPFKRPIGLVLQLKHSSQTKFVTEIIWFSHCTEWNKPVTIIGIWNLLLFSQNLHFSFKFIDQNGQNPQFRKNQVQFFLIPFFFKQVLHYGTKSFLSFLFVFGNLLWMEKGF